jgi:hypothetical protein
MVKFLSLILKIYEAVGLDNLTYKLSTILFLSHFQFTPKFKVIINCIIYFKLINNIIIVENVDQKS